MPRQQVSEPVESAADSPGFGREREHVHGHGHGHEHERERGHDHEHELREARRWVIARCRPDAGGALEEGMRTVAILAPLKMDAPGLLAALLQPLLPVSEKEQALIAGRFGPTIPPLLHGAARMRQLSSLSRRGGEFTDPRANEENLRKMLIAMVDDVRVVLIELARHLSALRHGREADRETRRELGRVTLDVYAPLANRLGVGQIKWRMEDYALRCLEPEAYHRLAAALDEKRGARERYIGELIAAVQGALEDAAIVGEVHGRPKHLYSIWKKMRLKGLTLAGLRDLRGLRIVVGSVADCYAALAAVHARWRPVPGEFDDYVATPKANGYRSIHTVVAGPGGKEVEVQVRTREMHRQSELGVAAHWRYKEKVRADEGIDQKVARLRQLLEWKEELRDAGALAERPAAAGERVYVFTPKGAVIDLPAGATPVDFAYAIHTELGHSIRGARVNGKMAPLSRRLETGQQVRVQTVKGGGPSRDWLRDDPGYARTRRARARIAQWFKRADYDQHLAEGRGMLERELARLGMEEVSYEKIARAAPFKKTDDLLAALGAGDFKVSRALAPFRRAAGMAARREPVAPHKPARQPAAPARPGDFSVSGVGNLLTRMAHCCDPVPGDAIVGFITTGRGVSIHRRNCRNLKNLDGPRRERLVEVQWGESERASRPVEIHLTAYHRGGLLHDVTEFLNNEKVPVLKLTMETDEEHGADIHLQLEISGLRKLEKILTRLARIPDVFQVRRSG